MKRRNYFPLLLAVVLGGLTPARSQEALPNSSPEALTLERAIGLALTNNPELHASGARVTAAAGRADQARRWSNPELELNAEDWPVNDGQGFSDAKQTIGIAQTLPFPGKKSLDRQIGGAGVKLSAAELALRRIETVRDVKAAFFRALAAEQLVAVTTQLVAVAESSATAMSKRVETGDAAFQEQLRAEVQLEQVRTEQMAVTRELASARLFLAALLGQADLKNVPLTGALAEQPNATLLDTSSEAFLTNHPSLSGAQANLDRARLENRRARLEPYPDVKVGVAGGRIGESDESIIQIGFTVPLPILDRGKGRQQEAQANVRVAEAELHVVQQQLQREWGNARERYRTAAAQVATYRDRILPKSAEALHLVQTGFEQGKFSFIDLVDTQRTTAEARLAYQGKLLELNLAQAELEALLPLPAQQPANSK